MGNTPSGTQKNVSVISKRSHLSAWELYKYEVKYDLSIAELEYCFSRFLDLHDVSETKDKERSEENHTSDNKSFFEALQSDWVLGEIYRRFFERTLQKNSVPTFEQYLETVLWWNKTTSVEKLEFLYKLINPRNDVKVTIWDLTFMLQKLYAVELNLGNPVRIRQDPRSGILRYTGPVAKKPGIWAGIELFTPDGKNDGSVLGTRYFQCDTNHGVFVEISEIDPESIHAMAVTILTLLDPNQNGYIEIEGFLNTLESDGFVHDLLDRSWLPSELGKGKRERSKSETEVSSGTASLIKTQTPK